MIGKRFARRALTLEGLDGLRLSRGRLGRQIVTTPSAGGGMTYGTAGMIG